MYYESSDEEDEVGEVGNTPLPPGVVKCMFSSIQKEEAIIN